jgi:TRAP-type C4-dicarboxylate transport system permease small subunit
MGDERIGSFERIVHRFSRMLDVLSGIALALMMGLVFVNVALRAVWIPILGTYEFTGFLAALTISLALAHCAAKKGHVAITLFADMMPTRIQAILDTIVSIFGIVLYSILAWQCSVYAIVMYHSGEVGLTTLTPFYPLVLVVAFGFAMLALVLLNDFFKSLQRIFMK